MPFNVLHRLRPYAASLLIWLVYASGVSFLAAASGTSWAEAAAMTPFADGLPAAAKTAAVLTLLSGTALVYFIPGVFIARDLLRDGDGPVPVFGWGFLINYLFYYGATTLYKSAFHQPVTREAMAAVILCLIAAGAAFALLRGRRAAPSRSRVDTGFLLTYALVIAAAFFICRDSIFTAMFGADGDGAEQYWAAQSLQTMILPTIYREPYTIIPQFPFAPTVYLNMFSLALFGHVRAEFIIKIEILVAFVCMGFVLKHLAGALTGGGERSPARYVPLFLYLTTYLVIISFRAAYVPPTDLAKSNETVQLALFLTGFWFMLADGGKGRPLPAVAFMLLAAFIRHNGMMMITAFLALHALLFRTRRFILPYLAGWAAAVLLLKGLLLILMPGFSIADMVYECYLDCKGLTDRAFDPRFVLDYLKGYTLFTAGFALFVILQLKNRYMLLFLLTTAFYMTLPFRSVVVPAHFFGPVFMFPLLGYYLYESRPFGRAGVRSAVVLLAALPSLAVLAHALPASRLHRNIRLERFLALICTDAADMREAAERGRLLRVILDADERILMYYMAHAPEPGREYLLRFGPLPPGERDRYREYSLDEFLDSPGRRERYEMFAARREPLSIHILKDWSPDDLMKAHGRLMRPPGRPNRVFSSDRRNR